MLDRLRQRLQAPRPIPDDAWIDLLATSPVLGSLHAEQQERLRLLAQRFVHITRFPGAQGFRADARIELRIAAEACLLVLELPEGLGHYRRVHDVIVYPSGFRVDQRWTDEAGVEHEREAELAGEAWQGGPVILACDDVESPGTGFNVVLHEFAHVLDAGNGSVNGFPAITDAALRARWPDVFTRAYDALSRAAHRGREMPLDTYALEDPAEFFAVATEAFFTDSVQLAAAWPDVYAVLAEYYRQQPVDGVQSFCR